MPELFNQIQAPFLALAFVISAIILTAPIRAMLFDANPGPGAGLTPQRKQAKRLMQMALQSKAGNAVRSRLMRNKANNERPINQSFTRWLRIRQLPTLLVIVVALFSLTIITMGLRTLAIRYLGISPNIGLLIIASLPASLPMMHVLLKGIVKIVRLPALYAASAAKQKDA